MAKFKQGYDMLDDAFVEKASQLTLADNRDRFNSYEPTAPVIATKKVHYDHSKPTRFRLCFSNFSSYAINKHNV